MNGAEPRGFCAVRSDSGMAAWMEAWSIAGVLNAGRRMPERELRCSPDCGQMLRVVAKGSIVPGGEGSQSAVL